MLKTPRRSACAQELMPKERIKELIKEPMPKFACQRDHAEELVKRLIKELTPKSPSRSSSKSSCKERPPESSR
jgi:hypothetical protein